MTHNTHMSVYIPPAQIQKTAGTWTPTVSTHLIGDVRTAENVNFTLIIPVALPGNSEYRAGCCLKSVDLFYKVATADLDGLPTVALKKKTLPASGAVTGADAAITLDAAHDAEAERITQASHTLTAALAASAFLDDGDAYELVLVVDPAAGSVFTLYGARANYEWRV